MKTIQLPALLVALYAFLFLYGCNQDLRESNFCKSLSAVSRILEEPGWTNWCMAPVYDENGKIHLFAARWPEGTSWLKEARIDHYMAERPEGPYTFVGNVLKSDSISYYNPQINFHEGKYVLVYAFKEREAPNFQQKVGIATSESLYGPWSESIHNPVLGPTFIPGSADYLHASNPTLLKDKEGRYRIYYKSISDKPDNPYLRTISLAISEKLEGPYHRHEANPLITYVEYGVDVEDPYAFVYNGRYFLILEDRQGVADVYAGKEIVQDKVKAGGVRPGLIYTSSDGIDWGKPRIGYRNNSFYFDEPIYRFERPHVLWKDGKPDYLFLALEGGKYGLGTGAVLKINDWKGK